MEDRILQKLRDLAKGLKGDLYLDSVSRVAYSTDASIYQIMPGAVFCPKDREDVKKIVEFSHRYGLPLISRGAGTNMTGGVLGKGIVLDFAKYMNKILKIDPVAGYVLVEPGVVHGELQRELAKYGKFFPPDPSSSDYCTLGGVVANNSSGIRALKYGDAKDWVLDIRGFLYDGTMISTEVLNSKKSYRDPTAADLSFEERLAKELYALLMNNRALIESREPYVTKNSSGYNLKGSIAQGSLDWNRLMTGSEGTLAVFTSLKLRLADLPKERVLFLAEFASLEDSLEKIAEIADMGPCACEIMDDFIMDLILKENSSIRDYILPDTRSILLIEFEGDAYERIKESAQKLHSLLNGLALRIKETTAKKDSEFLWGIRKAASPILNRIVGSKRPVRMVEDIAVHPKKLKGFMAEFKSLLYKHGLDTGVHGHAGSGNLHLNPNMDLADPDYKEKIRDFTKEAYGLVKAYNGTISGEHGDGMLRAPFVNIQEGALADVYAKVKKLFDPQGILNPGKKVTCDARMNLESLRYDYEYGRAPGGELSDDDLKGETAKCNGCGACRMYCPVASATLDEKDTARTKLNVIKMLAAGGLSADDETLYSVRKIIDHCINCKRCLTDCPTVVDVPRLCVEAKRMLVKRLGADFTDMYAGDIKKNYKAVALTGPVANSLLENRTARALMDKFVGIDQRRKLPGFKRTPVTGAQGVRESMGEEKVLYHPGCFAQFNDPQEAQGTVKILLAAGVTVETLDADCCYVSSISNGTYERYIEPIAGNVRNLKGYIDKGYKIVTSSASCGLAMKVEYPRILKTNESYVLSQNSYDIHEYLLGLYGEGFLKLKFKSCALKSVYHEPCHLKARKSKANPADLLRLIPGLDIEPIEDFCCGMAGTFGMKSENYDLSMKIGEKLFRSIIASGAEIVLTNCGTCKIQIEQGTGLVVLHTMEFMSNHLCG